MLREKIVLPKIGPIRWRKDGYGIQKLKFSTAGQVAYDGRGFVCGEEVPDFHSIQRGYVKIWKDGRVVDRALTVKAARKRIAKLKAGQDEQELRST